MRNVTDRINAALARRDAFAARVTEAGHDTRRLADLMAEAIAMSVQANGLEAVGRDGRARVSIEEIAAAHCMAEAQAAYLRARKGSNDATG